MSRRPQVEITAVSGNRYDEPRGSYVWIPSSSRWRHPTDPIFHSIRTWDSPQRYQPEDGAARIGRQSLTVCGVVMSSASWLAEPLHGDFRHSEEGMEMPIRWALRFARPCRRCWP